MKRLDVYLAEIGLSASRSAAAVAVKTGKVLVNGRQVKKPAFAVGEDDEVQLTETPEFVGRGGLKLKKALAVFSVRLTGAVCLDIGASTGGFTDCMLKNGASRVYAVDVGVGQLAPVLCADDRVVNMEKTNIRDLSDGALPPVDFIGADVSFISLTHVLPAIDRFLKPDGTAVCLVKPQFEAGRASVGKNGVVRSARTHVRVLRQVCAAAAEIGLFPEKIDYSPITGGEGNIEYLLCLTRRPVPMPDDAIESTVEDAHKTLQGGH